MPKAILISFFYLFSFSAVAQQTGEKDSVLTIVQQFFDAMNAQDTATFNKLYIKGAGEYYVTQMQDSVLTGSRLAYPAHFRQGETLDERLVENGIKVEVHQRIAMLWAPYKFWINNTFSHCGIDVFTLFKTDNGWKIANITFSVERDGCDAK